MKQVDRRRYFDAPKAGGQRKGDRRAGKPGKRTASTLPGGEGATGVALVWGAAALAGAAFGAGSIGGWW